MDATPHDAAAYALAGEFGTVADLVRLHADRSGGRLAIVHRNERLTYRDFDVMVDQVAASLQRDGIAPGAAIAICAASSIAYAATFLGALRVGIAVAPLAPSSTPESLAAMVRDCGAQAFFLDAAVAGDLGPLLKGVSAPRIALDDGEAGARFSAWLTPAGTRPSPVTVSPDAPFNIIYSSGTTGTPKGIVQSHRMRWSHVHRGALFGYGPDAVTLISTPLYSNTTLVAFLPTLAHGGTVVLMEKFDPAAFLATAAAVRATHAMLVPVQYRRLLEHPDFDKHDLSSFKMKFSTSAPFHAALKAEVLRRWPGGLVEFYGMTEGGGTCILAAHDFPDKLHTVGRPSEGHDIRVIDAQGRALPPGETGEVVGHSGAMMAGYFNQEAKTREAEWYDPDGKRFIRTGDIGRFDADGFLTLLDRAKDMVISGGFNIYPSDLEAVICAHPAVAEAAVVGVASERWGETPVAFVTLRSGQRETADALRAWANARLGKTQRLADLRVVETLPRSAIGKVLKRELRDRYGTAPGGVAGGG